MKHAHLTHFDMNGYYQFITFRTADSTDSFLLRLESQNRPNRENQMAMDEYLDVSRQGAYLQGDVLQFLFELVKAKNGDLYDLICFAIMPNHVHLLIKPLHKLSVVMQRVKAASAKGINDMLGRRGTFWEKDYYDKPIRDEEYFRLVYQYIKNNPLKLNATSATKVAPPNAIASASYGGAASAAQRDDIFPERLRFYGIYDD